MPLCHLRRISQMRPVVIDHECVAARLDMWRRWVQQHNAWGIWFALDTDGRTVVPVSEDGELSPCFVEHVASRSEVLAQFLADQVMPVAAPAPARVAEPTEGDRLIWAGIKGAKKQAAKTAARQARIDKVRDRRAEGMEQMSLLEE